MSRHDAWVTLVVGVVLVLVFTAYSANVRGVAYKIPINGMLPGHGLYRAAVAMARVGAALFAVCGLAMVVKGLSVVVG